MPAVIQLVVFSRSGLYCLYYETKLNILGVAPMPRCQVTHFGFEGGTLVLIASVPGHCLPITFSVIAICPLLYESYLIQLFVLLTGLRR